MSSKGPGRLVLAAVAWTFSLVAFAEPAVTIRPVILKQQPATDAPSVAKIPAETAVDLVKREGGWVQLKAGPNTGWAKIFDVRTGASGTAATRSSGSGVGDVLNLASGNRGSSVTTGVRGLDADMLAKAQPNFREVTVLIGYAATPDRAQAFAQNGRLQTRQIDLLAPTQPPKDAPR